MKKALTKQAKYKAKISKFGFIKTEVTIHPDDRHVIQNMACKLRKKRGYDGQPKRATG